MITERQFVSRTQHLCVHLSGLAWSVPLVFAAQMASSHRRRMNRSSVTSFPSRGRICAKTAALSKALLSGCFVAEEICAFGIAEQICRN